jgi:dTDP-4-dehydrorhamnose 3,5-epimerase
MRTEFRRGWIQGVVVRELSKHVDERGWLAELFRQDELPEEFHPQMAYIAQSEPHALRGPHEHLDQADLFCFIGGANFKLRLWDNRSDSETYHHVMTLLIGADNPTSVLIPKGIVHAYHNMGDSAGLVINFPNRLFRGENRSQAVDEIRYEDDPDTIFRMED